MQWVEKTMNEELPSRSEKMPKTILLVKQLSLQTIYFAYKHKFQNKRLKVDYLPCQMFESVEGK